MRKLLFVLLCLGLICISCSKDEEKDEKEYYEGIGVEREDIVLPMDTISYKNQNSYGCDFFIENSVYTLRFKTDFDYEIVIEPTQYLSWESIRRTVNTKANILEYNPERGIHPLIQKISIQRVSHGLIPFEKIEIFDINNYIRYNLRNSKAYIDFAYKDYDSIDPEIKNQYIRLFRLVFEGEDITIKVLLNYRGS